MQIVGGRPIQAVVVAGVILLSRAVVAAVVRLLLRGVIVVSAVGMLVCHRADELVVSISCSIHDLLHRSLPEKQALKIKTLPILKTYSM